MKRALIFLLLVAGVAAGAWFGFREQVAVEVAELATGEAPGVRDIAPDSRVYYVEMHDLAGNWDRGRF